MMKTRILAAFLALLFVVSTALVSCDELDSMLEDLSSGLESGEVDDELESGKHNGKNDKDDDDDRDDDDEDDRYDDGDDDRYDDDDDRYDDDDDDRFGTGKDDSNDKDTMTQYPDSEYDDETFTSPEDSEESDKPSTNRPEPEKDSERETNDYSEDTFTLPDTYIEVGENVDFEGQELNIIVRDYKPLMREWYKDVPEDEVDEVIAYRNEHVAAMIDVKITYTLAGSSDYEDCLNTFTTAIMEDVDNGFHYYDIVANYAYASANVMVRDYLANLADNEVFPYFDFTLPCWNQAIVSTTLCNDKLYYITGDLNLSTFDKSMVVFVNKELYNDRKDASDPEDLQDVALDGLWDYEDLYKWTSVYEDTNSDGTNSHDDLHGINAYYGSIPVDAMPYAWDLEYLVEEADGSHSYNVIGNTKIATAVDMAKALFHGVTDSDQTGAQGVANWNWTGACSLGGYSEPVTHFATERSVFLLHLLYCTADDNVMLREMSSEFGLLPMPKYDEDQENYGTTSHDAYTLVTVIDHWDIKGEAISAYLQVSYEESYIDVRGYYINEIVKQKYFGMTDTLEKSQDIFDIIADNVEFTFISVYAPQLNAILYSCWREVVTESNGLGATTAEEAFLLDETMYEASLAEVDQWLGLI